MSNVLYTKGKEALLDGSIIWTTSNIRAMLVDKTVYSVDAGDDRHLGDIPVGARVVASPVLSGRTALNGAATADNPTWPIVTWPTSVGAVVVYADTGNPSTSRLLMYIDSNVAGLPFTPNGGAVTLNINPAGLFAL